MAVGHRGAPFIELAQEVTAYVGVERCSFVEVDRRFDGFALAEEEFLEVLPFGIDEPVVEQLARDARDMGIVSLTPTFHLGTHGIDEGRMGVVLWDIVVRKDGGPRLPGRDADGGTVGATPIQHLAVVEIAVEVGIVVPARFFVGIVEYGGMGFHGWTVECIPLTPKQKRMVRMA